MEHFNKTTSSSFSTTSSSPKELVDDKTNSPISKGRTAAKSKSVMLAKFQAYVEPSSLPPYYYTPRPFFFYGTLTDPSKLQELLQLDSPPVLKPARVSNYKIMLWGQYPALVRGQRDSYVDGMTYVVETEQHLDILKDYETEVYEVRGIRIKMDGKAVSGRVFMWASRDLSQLSE